ncbi:MAG: oligosaccharide flippase family protein [Ardenticatenaceae bacterium]|nr:oligosaccharide flippase family protein [Ardenticatenaceae bacterium]
MQKVKKYKVDLIIILGFFVLPLFLYGDVTLGSKTMLPVDNLYQWQPWQTAAAQFNAEIPQNSLLSDLIIENYAWKRFIRNSLQQGDIPLWNPYLFAGAPFLAAGQHSGYYPFSLLFLIMPLTKAYGWFTVSQLWLAGVFMYAFGRVLKMHRASAALAGLIYQGCGFLVVSSAVFPMIIAAAAWLPLLLACIEKIIGDWRLETRRLEASPLAPLPPTFLWLALGSIALGCQILAGHIEITYYTLLLMALYAGWRLVSNVWQRSRGELRITHYVLHKGSALLGLVVIGLLLGAIQLIPLYEVGQTNFREGSASFEEVQSYAFPKRRILTLLLPNFFGNPSHHSYVDVFDGHSEPFQRNAYNLPNPRGANTSSWGLKNYVEGGIYLGILPLFLAFLGVIGAWQKRQRWSETGFFVLMSLISLAFIFGTPLYAILYYGLPFINQLHTPFRWVFPLSLFIAALAGFGVDYLAQTRGVETGEGRLKKSLVSSLQSPIFLWSSPSIITLLAGLTFWSGLFGLIGLYATKFFYERLAVQIYRLFNGLAAAKDAFPDTRAFYSYEFRQFFLLGLILMGTGVVLRVSRCPIFWRGRPLYLYLAAILISLDIFIANFSFHTAVDPALLEYKPQLVQWLEQQPQPWRLTSFNPNGDIPFHANSGWLYDLPDIRGYDSIIPKQYTTYMAAIEPQNGLQFNRVQPIANWQSLNSPLLDVLGVKYIITSETVELPKLQEVWQGEGLRVYENLAVAPRAYTLPQTATAVVPNALSAMTTDYDPRHFAVVETGDWRPETAQSPVSSQPVSAPVTYNSNREVVVQTAVSTPAWLILNDSYAPGWKAFVRPADQGEEAEQEHEIFLVNGNFRGVLLEPGEWVVRFRYSPQSFVLGGLASVMGVMVLLLGTAVTLWQRYVGTGQTQSAARSVLKNSAAPMALNLFNKGIDFLFAAYYLRVLGPADAGSYATAIAAALIFEIIANFGLNLLLVREVSQDRSQASRYLLNTTVLRVGTAVLATIPVALYLLGSRLTDSPLTAAEINATLFIMVGMVFSGMAQGITGLFYVYEKAEIPATMTTATTILKVGFGVVALLMGYGFVGLAAVSILTNLITLTLLSTLATRHFALTGPWQLDWQLQRHMLSLGYPLMLIHLLQTIFISSDVILLRQINGEEVVGWYSSAYKWFNALQIVPSFFTLALFPIIAREVKNSLDSARRMYTMSLKLMLLLALPIAAVTAYLAFPLVRLVGGEEFLPHGAIALQLVIASIPIGWLNSVTNYVLIALGLESKQPRAFTIAVAFNIITNLIFLPMFSYRAAAITTVLSEVVLLLLFHYYLRQKMAGVQWGQLLVRPLSLTAIMVAAMFLGQQLHLIIGLLLGLILYPAGLILLHIITPEERALLQSLLPAPIATRLKLV